MYIYIYIERERDTVKLCEWNDKILNALAQDKPVCGKAINNLNKKLGTMGGASPEA